MQALGKTTDFSLPSLLGTDGPVQPNHFKARLCQVLQCIMCILGKDNLEGEKRTAMLEQGLCRLHAFAPKKS